MKRFIASSVIALVAPLVLFASPVHAVVQSSISGGDIYQVKDVTKGGSYTDPVSADACDTLRYMVRIHNGGPTEVLTNTTVQVVYQTSTGTKNVSSAIVRASNASPTNTSDTSTVNLSSAQMINFVSGSAKLLDANSNTISNLSDDIIKGGVSIGNVGVSINEKRFVIFDAKVNCPTPPTTPETPKSTPPVTSLPNTGPGNVVGIFAGVSAVAGTTFHFVRRRTV